MCKESKREIIRTPLAPANNPHTDGSQMVSKFINIQDVEVT